MSSFQISEEDLKLVPEKREKEGEREKEKFHVFTEI